jgi:serine/threonine protein phosphatase PrpC
MLCPSCHTLNRDNAKFCKGCGRSFAAEQKSIETAGTPTPVDVAIETSSAPIEASSATQVSAPASTGQENAAANGSASLVEDMSMVPTQILTPAEMVAYHARRWQQEGEREQTNAASIGGDSSAASSTAATGDEQDQGSGEDQGAVDVADMPTIIVSPAPLTAPSPAAEGSGITPATADEVPSAEVTGTEVEAQPQATETAQPADAAQTQVPAGQPAQLPAESSGTSKPQEQETQAAQNETGGDEEMASLSAGAFPVLEVGANVAGRYEVVEVLNAGELEHTYQVIDHQGYQRCWNCGSEQNTAEDEFCTDCGAELLNVAYTMHEYAAAARPHEDASVLLGQIVNTFMEGNNTYVIEQPQIAQPAFPNGVHLLVASDSDAGVLRRGDPNEDSTLTLQMQRIHESLAAPVGVFIVADGMGGHADGQGASRMTINVIADRIVRELLAEPLAAEKAGEPPKTFSEDDLVAMLKGAIQDANLALCQDNQRNKTDKGSTVTGFMIVGDHAYIINVGDSRTYMLRDGKLYQLTNDHSLVSQLVASGMIEPDDVYTHPQRSQIFRSLGDKPNVLIDDFKQQLHPGDILLSCCDGLWEMVRNPQITEILTNAPDPQTACTQLIDAANANGGEDNVSVVVVFVRG